MQPPLPRRPRARPVADAPLDVLLPREADLAKAWLLAVVEQVPLGEVQGVLASDVARDGPLLCAAVLRALTSDAELARLGEGGPLEPLAARAGEVVGARELGPAITAVESLAGVLWSAVRGALVAPDATQVSELAERLALVMESVRRAVLRHGAAERAPGASTAPEPEPAVEPHPEPEPEPEVANEPDPPPPRLRLEPIPDVEPGVGGSRGGDAAPDALWKGALRDEIDRALRGGVPLALLLIELDDAERMRLAETAAEAGALFSRFLQAVRGAVRRQDILARETDDRIWVIARDTARPGAQALAGRALDAVRTTSPWRGAPLSISVGIAVLREDSSDLEELVGAAEEACLAAAAQGAGVLTRPDRRGA